MTTARNVTWLWFLLVTCWAIERSDGQMRPRQIKQPDGLYLPPYTTKSPEETEEQILPGGYTPPPESTIGPDEMEEQILPGGYTPPPESTTEPPSKITPTAITQPPRKVPPRTTTEPPRKIPPPEETDQQIDAAAQKDDWNGGPFEFGYEVKDDKGNDYSHKQKSDGDLVRGEYRTLMPDGRMQVVTYTADWKNGYRAIVKYY